MYIDWDWERTWLTLAVLIVLAGSGMSVAAVGMATYAYFDGQLVIGIVAGLLALLLPFGFYNDKFFWIVWATVVAISAISVFSWWSLIILAALIVAVILVIVTN